MFHNIFLLSCPYENAIKEDVFLKLMETYKQDLKTSENLNEAFSVFDKNGDGFFTTESLRFVDA